MYFTIYLYRASEPLGLDCKLYHGDALSGHSKNVQRKLLDTSRKLLGNLEKTSETPKRGAGL